MMRRPALVWLAFSLAMIPARASQVPAGAALEVRLERPLSSYSSKSGTPVDAVLVAPVRQDDCVLIPIGTRVLGTLRDVRRVGWGLVRENARLDIEFHDLVTPDGVTIPVKTRVVGIDNAREHLDTRGRIIGIRSTATISHRGSFGIASIALADPIAFLFWNVAASIVLRFPEPEINFPAGAEFILRLVEPLEIALPPFSSVPPVVTPGPERNQLLRLITALPVRTRSAKSGAPSDLTNVLIAGRRASLERAFAAAGWVRADFLTARTVYRTIRSLAQNQGYQEAPMSTLRLDEQVPDYEFSKSLNTFVRRHHARLWERPQSWNGSSLWAVAGTQDISIRFSRRDRVFTHRVDEAIDNERAKIVNDLLLTGCVEAAETVGRPWVPRESYNARGERLVTDGAIAVLRLNDCETPYSVEDANTAPAGPLFGSVTQRIVRQTILTLRNDIVRGSFVWQGVEGLRYLARHRAASRKAPQPRPVRVPGVAESDLSAAESQAYLASLAGIRSESASRSFVARPPASPLPVDRPWTVPMMEIGLQTGELVYGAPSFGSVRLRITPKEPGATPVRFLLSNRIRNGWTASAAVTLNTHRWVSHEIGFVYQRARFSFGNALVEPSMEPVDYRESTTGLSSRQFSYNTLLHLRPREARLRLYVAAGPALQVIHLTGNAVQSSASSRFGMRNIGIRNISFFRPYNIGNDTPITGGGIYQPAVQYGGGLKYRLAPHWMLRLDFRETLSKDPDFFGRSFPAGKIDSPEATLRFSTPASSGLFRQQRVALGLSFTF